MDRRCSERINPLTGCKTRRMCVRVCLNRPHGEEEGTNCEMFFDTAVVWALTVVYNRKHLDPNETVAGQIGLWPPAPVYVGGNYHWEAFSVGVRVNETARTVCASNHPTLQLDRQDFTFEIWQHFQSAFQIWLHHQLLLSCDKTQEATTASCL